MKVHSFDDHAGGGRTTASVPSDNDPLQQQQRKKRQAMKRALKFVPPYHVSTSNVHSDSSTTNGSTTDSQAPSFRDVSDGNGNCTRQPVRSRATSDSRVGSVRRMPAKCPSRHSSFDSVSDIDAVARFPQAASAPVNPFNTAPPSRLSRRATECEESASTSQQLSMSRPSALLLDQARRSERVDSGGSSNSLSRDQAPLHHASQSRSAHALPVLLPTVLPVDRRCGNVVSPLAASGGNGKLTSLFVGGCSSRNAPPFMGSTMGCVESMPTLMTSGSAVGRPQVAAGNVPRMLAVPLDSLEGNTASTFPHVPPGETAAALTLAGRREGAAARRRASIPLNISDVLLEADSRDTRSFISAQHPQHGTTAVTPSPDHLPRSHQSESNREAAASLPVGSVFACEGVATARGYQRVPPLTSASEADSRSPVSGAKRVHFKLQASSTESGFFGSLARLVWGDRGKSTQLLRGTAPVTFHTSPPMVDRPIAAPESSDCLAQSAGLCSSFNSSSGSGTASFRRCRAPRVAAPAAAASTGACPPFLDSCPPNDTFSGATYKPQIPLLKSALKSYSRYKVDSTGSSSDSTSANESKHNAAIRSSKATAMSLDGPYSQQRAATCYQQRRSLAGKSDEALAMPTSVPRQHIWSFEVIVKWSLLGLAALLLFLLAVLATAVG
ncbi:hypothetical protein ABL78_5634 [Leptomonas seymouri]|uniref:Uncharacterized protein n=1 Tax=Leptomonas seymouri TaxID=5684 RepID=A0A0N1PBB2_LEPSE|nr:hypothetical protein ABL78_5634 [Leptomonas seymouri]|eukprot:KPI85322.1 hypothetical protein ABL78_5634 [Leptomonas seymouri]